MRMGPLHLGPACNQSRHIHVSPKKRGIVLLLLCVLAVLYIYRQRSVRTALNIRGTRCMMFWCVGPHALALPIVPMNCDAGCAVNGTASHSSNDHEAQPQPLRHARKGALSRPKTLLVY
jgi:hypothetical protein